MNSPADTAKNIYGTTANKRIAKKHYFSWESWANFSDAGEKPMLKKYHYVTLGPQVSTALGNTGMSVKAFTLSHSTPYESTAFLINSSENYLLYLGDTGADTVEHSTNLNVLWQAVSPLIKRPGKLFLLRCLLTTNNPKTLVRASYAQVTHE